MKLNLSYQQVQEAVCKPPNRISAAEAHGVLTGMLCVYGELELRQWLSVLFDADEPIELGGDSQLLSDLCEQTRQALQDDDYAFELFSPMTNPILASEPSPWGSGARGFSMG